MLHQVAAASKAEGRSLRSASIKPGLQERARVALGEQFDEREFGFESFREFLRGAEAAGAVTILPAPIGPDVDILANPDWVSPTAQPDGAPARPTGMALIESLVGEAIEASARGVAEFDRAIDGLAVAIVSEAGHSLG